MTLNQLLKANRLPFMAAFFVALASMPLQIFDFHERQVGTAHAAPWRQKLSAAIDRALSPFTRLLAFLSQPAVQRAALIAAVVLLAVMITDSRADDGLMLAAGLTKQELLDKKGTLVTQADEILKKAKDEGRYDLSAEENTRWEAIHADIDKIDAFVDKLTKQEALAEGTGRRTEPPPTQETRTETRVFRPRDTDPNLEGLRSWLMAGCKQEITPEVREMATRHSVDLSAKHFTIKLPRVALRSVSVEGITEWRAALGVGAGAIGGFTVQDEMMRALEVSLLAFGGMRKVATVLRTETGAALPWPTMNDTANKGRRIGENAVHTNTDVAFGQIVFDAYKYSSDYVLVAWEFLQDSTINAAEVLGKALGERIGRVTNDEFTTGSGSSQPNGIVTASGAGVTGVADPPTYDNIMDLIHSVDPAYRENGAKFMLHDTTLKSLKKIKILQYSGDLTGAPLWQPSLVAGQPNMIHGYEYVVNQSMAVPGATAKKILFGDLSKYMLRDVRDITLIRADERFIEFGQVAFLAFSRHDGDLLDAGTDPVKHMQQT